MEQLEPASLYGFQKPPSFANANKEFYLPGLSDISYQYQSQPLTKSEPPINTVHLGFLYLKPALTPQVVESPSTSSRDELKTEDHQNCDFKIKCRDCNMKFCTEKAMFGHMRIHPGRGSKSFKRVSGSKRKSELIPDRDSNTECLPLKIWGATNRRGRKPEVDKKSPDAVAAFVLMDLSRGQKSTLDLVEHHSSPKKKMKMKQTEFKIGGMQEYANKKFKSRVHVCEVCGASFHKGQQLGGHKRAHYKNPQDQSGFIIQIVDERVCT